MVRLSELDRYAELVVQGPLGQRMTRRVLERFHKDEITTEERQGKVLQWLEELRAVRDQPQRTRIREKESDATTG